MDIALIVGVVLLGQIIMIYMQQLMMALVYF